MHAVMDSWSVGLIQSPTIMTPISTSLRPVPVVCLYSTGMAAAKSHHVVLISTPTYGNLVPTVEFAQRLADHHPRLSPIVFLISAPNRPVVNDYNHAAAASHPKIRFIHLPPVAPPSADEYSSSIGYLSVLVQKHKPLVQQAVAGIELAAMFVDMFCTPIADVAAELGIPCYLYFASPATFLGYIIHVAEEGSSSDMEGDDELLSVPCFVNPLPKGVLPTSVVNSWDGYSWLIKHAHRYMEMKGMVVNTLEELEPHALLSLSKVKNSPKVYAVGPVLDLAGPVSWHPDRANQKAIMEWLDEQPVSSVVFLCFGSMGSLSAPQVREIAAGLERSGHRFLWSLREPPKAKMLSPTDYSNVEEALPEGFLDRTAGIGLVCGWAPQVTVLAHVAIGGFVTHCGWNSLLESLWHGVPTATWPIYAEQQMNAFEMVKELGLAVELRLDYREGCDELVRAEEVEKRVKELMVENAEVRRKVKEMSQVSRRAVVEGGSSYESMSRLVQQLLI